jgi:hypothetical protein
LIPPLDNIPLLYQIEQCGANLIHISHVWNMDIGIAIQLDLLSDQQPIHNPPESRPPLSVSGGSLDEEDVAGSVWDELEAVLQAQEEVVL